MTTTNALTAAERQSLARARKRDRLVEYRAGLQRVIEAQDIATARKLALDTLVTLENMGKSK